MREMVAMFRKRGGFVQLPRGAPGVASGRARF